MNERSRSPKEPPRFTVILGGRMAEKHREEQARQTELQKFIVACEKLYEKNQAKI